MGGWSLFQLTMGKRWTTPWTVHLRAAQRQTRKNNPACSHSLLGTIRITNKHIFFGWWEESGVLVEKPHMHGKTCKLHTRNSLAVWRQRYPPHHSVAYLFIYFCNTFIYLFVYVLGLQLLSKSDDLHR